MNKFYQLVSLLTLTIALLASSLAIGQADLSLSLQQSSTTPSQYSSYSVRATLTNDGPQTATNVKTRLRAPAGTVFSGGNEFTTSSGSFSPYGSQLWSVPSLASGASVTLTVNLFLQVSTAPATYSQVTSSDQNDPDSTPGNGNGQVNEDDEASTNGGPTGQADLRPRNLRVQNPSIASGTNLEYLFNIQNAGTADVPGDFKVRAYLSTDNQLSANDIQDGTITTGNFDAGAQVNNIQGASNTSALSPGSYFLILVVDADEEVAESNENNNISIQPFTITGNNNCNIVFRDILDITCDNAGTINDPSDDIATMTYLAGNGNVSGAFQLEDLQGTVLSSGSYGSPATVQISNLASNPGARSYRLRDVTDQSCVSVFQLATPSPCSNSGGGDIDLSLTLSQNPPQPSQYTIYTVTATVSNAGPQTATGVKVDLPSPAGVVYQGGNEYSASQGSLSTYGSNAGEWTVGSIASGASATIDINYFARVANVSDSYGEVAAANEQDSDSTPGNGNGQVNEDDEASTGTINPVCQISTQVLNLSCDDNGTANNSADDTYSFTLVANATNGSSNYQIQLGSQSLTAAYGVNIVFGPFPISGSAPSMNLALRDAQNSSCTTTVQISTPAPCSTPIPSGPCTFEQPISGQGFDLSTSRKITAYETNTGFDVSVNRNGQFNGLNSEVATYTFAPDGTQLTTNPTVTTVDYSTSVDVDFNLLELIVEDANNVVTRVPFTDPFPAGAAGTYDGGFATRLPDGSGYLVFVKRLVNASNSLRSFVIDNNYNQVGGVSDYGTQSTRFEGIRFEKESGRGGWFIRIFERGTNHTFALLDSDFGRETSVSLGVNGRFYQPVDYLELADGGFTIASFFDGASGSIANRVQRYNSSGSLTQEYFGATNFDRRDAFEALLRPDGGYIGVSQSAVNGTRIEVLDENGSLINDSYLDALFDIDLLGLTSDMSILATGFSGSLNGQQVFLKLTPEGMQVCPGDYDPCDPPSGPTDPVTSFSTAAGGMLSLNYNLYGTLGSASIDIPSVLGVSLADPSTLEVQSTQVAIGAVYITGVFRDNVTPGNQQPFMVRADVVRGNYFGVIPALQSNDLFEFRILGNGDDAISLLTEYRTYSRSYGIARFAGLNLQADDVLVGDLVTNRVNGTVMDAEADLLYLSYRDGNSSSWPRLRILNEDDLSVVAEVLLGDAVLPNANRLTGDTGFPVLLPNGNVMVPFTASDNATMRYAAEVDGVGNIIATTLLPNFGNPALNFSTYSARGVTPDGDVLLEGYDPTTQQTERIALLSDGSIISCTTVNPQGVDLELEASSGQSQPQVYDVNSITFTLTNTGSSPATGIVVKAPKPSGVVYSGGNEYTASQGTMSTYGSNQGVWTVGNLAAGASATIIVNYFSLSTSGYTQFAEVTALNETDTDSSPDNGTGTSAVEDDEIYLDLTYGSRPAIALNFHPNPAPQGEQIVLKYESSGNTNVPVIISDLNGRVVFRSTVHFDKGWNTVPVSISDLPQGVYILALEDTGVHPTRLIVH